MLDNILKSLGILRSRLSAYSPNLNRENGSAMMASTKISQIGEAGLALIKSFEGLRLQSYKCPAGIWTIGYGHTGPDVTPGLTISVQEAENLLKRDLLRFERAVFKLVSVALTQNQFDALVSFCYNLGESAFKNSTLLKLLNSGNYKGAADEFLRWNKIAGKPSAGLTRRRVAERDLFLKVS